MNCVSLNSWISSPHKGGLGGLLSLSLTAALLLCSCDPVTITDITATQYKGDKQAAISFTYDDGMLCHYTDIAPQLEARGFRGTFWIIGANMDTNAPDYPWMTWEQVADLARRGHEISNHSWHHPNLTQIPVDSLRWEVAYNDSVIQAHTGQRPITFCYPYNALNEQVVSICSEGRVGTRTFQADHGQIVSHQTAESLTQWLNDLLAHRAWGVTMTHGTTYGWDYWTDPTILYNFYDEVKAATDRVWVATFAEAAAYQQEVSHLTLAHQQGHRQLTLVPMLQDLDSTLFREPVTICIKGNFTGLDITAIQADNTLPICLRDTCILLDVAPNGQEVKIEW